MTSGSSTPPNPSYLVAAMLSCRRPPRRRQSVPRIGFMPVAALLSALLVGVACGFGDDGTYSPPVPVAPEPATPAVIQGEPPTSGRQTLPARSASTHPASLRTGIPAIDAVIRAVATHDASAFAALLVLEPVVCAAPSDDGAAPYCPDDAAPGESMRPFIFRDCEFEIPRAGEPQRLARMLTSDSVLYAAFGLVDFQTASGVELSGYSVIFHRPGQSWVAHIAATGGVVAVEIGCLEGGVAALVIGLPAEKVILPPPDGMPPVEDTG